MTATCPDGHVSTASDYCDTCGRPIDDILGADEEDDLGSHRPRVGGSIGGTPPMVDDTVPCPSCTAPLRPNDNFCEQCGCDLVTGESATPWTAPAEDGAGASVEPSEDEPGATLVLTVQPDRSWYTELAETGGPEMSDRDYVLDFTLRMTDERATLGRVSRSGERTGIHIPLADDASDPAVSHHQCVFERDGETWTVRDDDSANGTWISRSDRPDPAGTARPLAKGESRALTDGDCIFIGAWTRIDVVFQSF